MIGLLIMLAAPQETPGYSTGAFNLVLRWGPGSPVVVRYESRARCEMAAVMVITQHDPSLDGKTGKLVEPDPSVSRANAPSAFCIPG